MKRTSAAKGLMMEMIVGGFMVLIFAGLVLFTIVLSREAWFRKKYAMEIVFQNVMGLREEDNAVVRGMPVGRVKRLELKPDGVHVFVSTDAQMHMRHDYKVTVVATSILGGRHIQVEEGSASESELPEDTVYRGLEPKDLMADAAEVASAVKRALVDGGVIEDLKQTVAQFKKIADTVSAGKGTLGRLLSEDDTLYSDMSGTMASLKTITARLEKGEGTLGRLMSNDDQLYRDLTATASSLKTIAARLENGEGTLGLLMSNDDQLYKDLTATAASMKTISGKIERGEGVIGRLVQDETLYDDLKATVHEMRGAIDDFRENTPVATFTSILFGAL